MDSIGQAYCLDLLDYHGSDSGAVLLQVTILVDRDRDWWGSGDLKSPREDMIIITVHIY